MLLKLRFEGKLLDAYFEVEGTTITFHSRSGTKGPGARNTQYGVALRLLLDRIREANFVVTGVWLDSKKVQGIPLSERVLLTEADSDATPNEMFTFITQRMRSVGQSPNAKSKGNNTKRIKITINETISSSEVEKKLGAFSVTKHGILGSDSRKITPGYRWNTTPISPDDMEWAEGEPRLINHLVKERARGLSQAKKSEFKRKHKLLFCEMCKMDPVEKYGSQAAEACIEVHHHATQLQDMIGKNFTKLEDLICLCANCHRITHYMLKNTLPR